MAELKGESDASIFRGMKYIERLVSVRCCLMLWEGNT